MSACVAPRHPKTMLVVLALSLLTLSAGARSPSATSVAEVWPQPVSFTQGTTQLTLTPGSFKIACGTSVCPAPLPAAFTRYLSLIFIGSASGKGLHANSTAGVNLPGVNVNVVADAPLALHVDESYTLTVRVRRGTAGCSMGVCACACVGGWRRARALWGRLNPRLAVEWLRPNLHCVPSPFPRSQVPSDGSLAVITARTQWGAIHALESFSQLVQWSPRTAPTYAINFAPIAITDAPRFPWRGALIDSSRHYLSVSTILRTLGACGRSRCVQLEPGVFAFLLSVWVVLCV